MLDATQKEILKKIIKLSNFSEVLDCMIEAAKDGEVQNYQKGNESISEDFCWIEKTLVKAKTEIKCYEQKA